MPIGVPKVHFQLPEDDQFFPHVSEAVCPLPAFSPLPWIRSKAPP